MPARYRSLLGAPFVCVLFSSIALAQDNTLEKTGDEQVFAVSPDALINSGGDERVLVVLKLSEQPVAVAQAQAPNQALSRAQRNLVEAKVEAEHRSILPHIEAAGGKVLARFAHAFNGVKIEVSRRELMRLSRLPGVVQVLPVRNYEHANATSVPFIGAPTAWGATPSATGKGVKVAIIDTGVDYTHANFGGPGTPADYVAACGADPRAAGFTACPNDAAPAPASLFGAGAPKVKGGTDLVGDAYTGSNTPVPDGNPLDCGGHGSHTAGTATGLGVTADGKTYTGPYNAAAYTKNKFKIGPGVAPEADLYAVRVFGCSGSTNVVTEAIDWAMKNGMDVISMSLGANFGDADSSDAQAAHNAAKAGLIVVAASGNAGPTPYYTSSPASGNGVITAAAMDHRPGFPGVSLALSPSGASIVVQNSNAAALADGTAYSKIVVLRYTGLNGEPNDNSVSNGCKEADWNPATNGGVDVTGALVVVIRGAPAWCDSPSSGARVFRAGAGQKYGAAAVALLNTGAGYPPFEGTIRGGDPATNPFGDVTIPFFGVNGPSSRTAPSADAAKLIAASSAIATNQFIVSPTYRTVAGFSSGGPRSVDDYFKPSVSAPGVSIVSTAIATGSEGAAFSGTSMATPHIAGVAALVRQAHSDWSSQDQRAAVMQTADPTALNDYDPRLEGSGLVQAIGATRTQVVARSDDDNPNPLSFGFAEFLSDHRASHEVQLRNHGRSAARFDVSTTITHGGAGVQVKANRSHLTIGPRDEEDLAVTLRIPAAAVGGSHDTVAPGLINFRDISGYVTLTPVRGDNNGVSLYLPFYIVPRVRSNVFSFTDGNFGPSRPNAKLYVSNFLGGYPGLPGFYSLGQSTTKPSGAKQTDVRAAGVRATGITGTDATLTFAINTFNHFTNPAPNEFDIGVDTAGGADPLNTGNRTVILLDAGRVGLSSLAGTMVSVTIDATGHIIGGVARLVDAPTGGSILRAFVQASELGLTASSPRFNYAAAGFDYFDGSASLLPGFGTYNAFAPALQVSALTAPINPNSFATFALTVNAAEWPKSTPAGLMVIDYDNRSGGRQAQIVNAQSAQVESE